jgi:hypothetical protein
MGFWQGWVKLAAGKQPEMPMPGLRVKAADWRPPLLEMQQVQPLEAMLVRRWVSETQQGPGKWQSLERLRLLAPQV